MRRKDREMPEDFAYQVVDKCEWATLSMLDSENKAYCVPLSIVRKDNFIYFHSAKDGHKIEALKSNKQVCMSCIGDTYRTPDKFTTEFESSIIFGEATEVLDDEEKILALRLLCERHTPSNMHEFDKAIERSLPNTGVWKIFIAKITGKRKKYASNGQEYKQSN